ncbi:MAG: hypothetical protein A2Y12_07360 [Planctomycetes bacterium GWF2_42_9]|nr:MAG: hypothetical protein A2Y12_07360 [Planctomycetes bacterium GWF2_42_9]HAL44532.1 hypothetical protein [Phycisphaerales bacterium]
MKNRKLYSGFTLVELLVVISIIAMLLSILLPAMSKVKEQARTVVCSTNLKNYGPALYMYGQENNGKCPSRPYWLYSKKNLEDITGGTESGGWVDGAKYHYRCLWHYEGTVTPDGQMWKYLKDKNVHICPTFKNFAMASGLNGCPNKSNHKLSKSGAKTPFAPSFSFSMNVSLAINWANTADIYSTMNMASVKRPGQCIAFSEENLWSIGDKDYSGRNDELHHAARAQDNGNEYSSYVLNDNCLWLNANKSKSTEGSDNIATYHKVGTNKRDYGFADAVFVDGHVSSIKGTAGYDAYLEYGRPYGGHEQVAGW